MEEITKLLEKLENNIPSKIKNKISGLERMDSKLELAKKEHETDPTDDSAEKLQNVVDYIKETTDEIIDDLNDLIEKRAKTPIVEAPIVEAPIVVEPIVEAPIVAPVKKPVEESTGIGWVGLIGGVVLLVATAGLVNTLRK
jgi:hypothetical protein